jgi:histone H3/H4
MDSGTHKLLESATHRTLHANNFSRSSSQASLVLTDLLSRYLSLLSTTCTKYAQHAGRNGLTAWDAFCALEELGVSMEELKEYCATEGSELGRYTVRSVRRVEDLNELKGQLGRASPTSRFHFSLFQHTFPTDSDKIVTIQFPFITGLLQRYRRRRVTRESMKMR